MFPCHKTVKNLQNVLISWAWDYYKPLELTNIWKCNCSNLETWNEISEIDEHNLLEVDEHFLCYYTINNQIYLKIELVELSVLKSLQHIRHTVIEHLFSIPLRYLLCPDLYDAKCHYKWKYYIN